MFWLGKLLGAIFGYLLGGPFGAIFGLILGHYFDISFKNHSLFFPHQKQHTYTQDIFFRATFTVMGYIAKADGRVSENEIRVATRIMQNMMLTSSLKQQAINYFREGKQANFDLDQILTDLNNACFQQQNLLLLFLEIQIQAAFADGPILKAKQRILEHICYRLGFNPNDFFRRYWNFDYGQRASGEHTRSRQQYQRYQPPSALESAYRLLDVNSTITNSDLKKVYRKLMSQNHPDKLVSKGLPEEMIKLATQKTQEIKQAYETICKARGI